MTDQMQPVEIRNGRDLFRETDSRFTYWYADAYGIQASFDIRGYQNCSLKEAKEIRDELDEIIEFCEDLEHPFPDLHE